MVNTRLSVRKTREVLRLHFELGLSQRFIAQSCGIGRSTIADYVHKFNAAGLHWPLSDDCDDEKLEGRLFPAQQALPKQRPEPDFIEIHNKLKLKGVTLMLLWELYKQQHPDGYQYSQYCEHYRQWCGQLDIIMRQQHKAGEKTFSDFAGTTYPITSRHAAQSAKAHLFVTTLGASSYTFARWYLSEDTEAWCNGHAAAFRFFGGCPRVIVPDNPKTTIDKPCRYEPDVHPEFQHMAEHHGAVVIPARVKKPRDKAPVESSVGVTTRWVIGVFNASKRTFYSLHELNAETEKLLERLNTKPFQKLPGCRKSAFEEIDKPALNPLPMYPYQFARINKARVNIDYHLEIDGHMYSVPYRYVRKQVEAHVTATMVDILYKGRRIAIHPRNTEKGKFTTLNEHRPKSHQQYLEWSPQRIINWANKTGPSTAGLVEAVMAHRPHPEQGFRSCLGIIRLERIFGAQRLEAACKRALNIGGYSYKSVKSILDKGLDKCNLQEAPVQLSIVHPNIRGASYYNTKEDSDVD